MPIPHPMKLLCLVLLTVAAGPAQAQLRGHGGPVRALAISADGTHAVSGSFDTSAIRWSLTLNSAEQVLRLHDSAVNAVAYLADGRVTRVCDYSESTTVADTPELEMAAANCERHLRAAAD